jgi:hypothetical protein
MNDPVYRGNKHRPIVSSYATRISLKIRWRKNLKKQLFLKILKILAGIFCQFRLTSISFDTCINLSNDKDETLNYWALKPWALFVNIVNNSNKMWT